MSDEVQPTKTLDVCGEICPYPAVNTIATLKKMGKGEVLEVLLDYPLSVERLPRNATKWAHKVLSIEKIDDGSAHRILIEAFGLK